MRSRIFFSAIAGFWVVMNFLLWRSQSARSQLGSAIPVQVVWDKILTAPDPSTLDVYDHDKNVGVCHWTATVGNATHAMNQSLSEDYEPDGLILQPSGYELNFDGNTAIFGTNHVGFKMHLLLSTNQTWQDFRFSGKMRPTAWDIHAIETSQKIMIKVNDDGSIWQKTLKFSDFEHPETLLGEIGGADTLGWAGVASLPLGKLSLTQAVTGIKWEAHEDWMQFGHSRVRVYRLETEIFGQRLYVFASRVGEILWVEAPNKLTLRNSAFSHF